MKGYLPRCKCAPIIRSLGACTAGLNRPMQLGVSPPRSPPPSVPRIARSRRGEPIPPGGTLNGAIAGSGNGAARSLSEAGAMLAISWITEIHLAAASAELARSSRERLLVSTQKPNGRSDLVT